MKEYAFNQRHMGVDVVVSFVTDSEALAIDLKEQMYITIQLYEQKFSRFLPNSELSLLSTRTSNWLIKGAVVFAEPSNESGTLFTGEAGFSIEIRIVPESFGFIGSCSQETRSESMQSIIAFFIS